MALPIHQYIYYVRVTKVWEKALGRRLKRAPRPLAEILDTDPGPGPSFFETELEKTSVRKIIFIAEKFVLESMKDFKAQGKACSPLERKNHLFKYEAFFFFGGCIRVLGTGHLVYKNALRRPKSGSLHFLLTSL